MANEIAAATVPSPRIARRGERPKRRSASAPTSEKKPFTTVNPDNGRLATIGVLELDTRGLSQRSCEGGGQHRSRRGEETGDGEPAQSSGVACPAPCRVCDQLHPPTDDDTEHAAHPAPATGQCVAPHRDYSVPSACRRFGSPSRGNWSSWKVTISVIAPPVTRKTSIVSGR